MSRSSKIFSIICAIASLSACASTRPAPEATPVNPSSAVAPAPNRNPMKGGMMGGGMMGAGGSGMMGGGMMSSMCPMTVPGTTVAVADSDGGVALTFTTTKSTEVAELRSRVKRMADMHNNGGMMGGGMMGGGMMGGGMMGASDGMMGGGMMGAGGSGMMGAGGGGGMMDAAATAEDVDGGARLVFKPKDAAQLEALRVRMKKHAEHMQHGQCPMMTAQTDGPPATPSSL